MSTSNTVRMSVESMAVMGRALAWFRAIVQDSEDAADKPHIDAIEEAIAAYDPERMAKCGNTVAAPGDVERRVNAVADFAHACGTLNYEAGENKHFDVIEADLRTISAALRSQGRVVTDGCTDIAVHCQQDGCQMYKHPPECWLPPGDVEQRARELLDAECIKRAPRSSALVSVSTALRAITAALRSQGQADAVELRGVRDTLIVAANNPVSHGGIGGLRELMLTQAHRITAALAQ